MTMPRGRATAAALPALAVALLPKCPACLGAYLAVGSSFGLDKLDPGVLWGAMLGALVLALALLGRAAQKRHRWLAFAACVAGAAVVIAQPGRVLQLVGVALLYAGALRIYLGKRLGKARSC